MSLRASRSPSARYYLMPAAWLAGIASCTHPTPSMPEASEDWTRDIVTTRLNVDIVALTATATLEVVASSSSTGLSLEAAGLQILGVSLEDGTALNYRKDDQDGSIDIGLPATATTLLIDYSFPQHGYDFDGYMTAGDTFIWPNYCGNLFPCHSDPADGLRFSVQVTGLEPGYSVVAPSELIDIPAPSYQLGFNVGRFTRHELGTTSAGTRVVFFSQPTDAAEDITAGTAHFREYVDTLEQYFGRYPFGPEVGAKSAVWCDGGGCAYAGMEEHPYFDVSDGSVNDPTVFTHETSHAWFGDGVRLECWGEDLVMSEGTASYLEIAILGLVDGEDAANADIQYYQEWLAESQADGEDAIVWPDTCDEVDTYSIWYSVTYSRGALFWMDVEGQVGRIPLIKALAVFAKAHLGQTATMASLLETVKAETGFDPNPLAQIWLRSLEVPSSAEPAMAAARQRLAFGQKNGRPLPSERRGRPGHVRNRG